MYYQHVCKIKEELKWAVYSFCGVEDKLGEQIDESEILPELLPIWRSLQNSNYDFYKFVHNREYELIEDDGLQMWFWVIVCSNLANLPISRFAFDELNGYLDFFNRDFQLKRSDVGWEGDGVVTDSDIMYYLLLCSTDEEIWKMMACGIGSVEKLYTWYKGVTSFEPELPCCCEKDEKKANDFLDYLLDESTNATTAVRRKAAYLKKANAFLDYFDKAYI